MPAALVKSPPTYRFVPDTANAYTTAFSAPFRAPSEPRANQLLPSQRATASAAGMPAALLKLPPTYRLVPDTASAVTRLFSAPLPDRKSTRLNSSHGYISYAVFCL